MANLLEYWSQAFILFAHMNFQYQLINYLGGPCVGAALVHRLYIDTV